MMDQDLNLSDFRANGRAAKVPQAHVVRELRREDLELLSLDRGVKAPAIKALRGRHHALARMLAQGSSTADCQATTGYSASHISILKDDPSFKELIAFYTTQVDEVYLDTHARLASLTNDAAAILQERIEDDPDKVSFKQLLEVVKLGADRTGFGPTSTQNTNINVGFAAKLEEARRRASERRMIDISPKEAVNG